MLKDMQTMEVRMMDQEKSLVLWKLLAMNGAMSVPYYLDDARDGEPQQHASLSLSRV